MCVHECVRVHYCVCVCVRECLGEGGDIQTPSSNLPLPPLTCQFVAACVSCQTPCGANDASCVCVCVCVCVCARERSYHLPPPLLSCEFVAACVSCQTPCGVNDASCVCVCVCVCVCAGDRSSL